MMLLASDLGLCCPRLGTADAEMKVLWLEPSSVQFSPLGRRRHMRDNSAEILFQSFLQEALVSSSGMGRDVQSLMLSI